MSPTEGVIREAWVLYKAHWRQLLPISFIVYVTIAIIGAKKSERPPRARAREE